MRLLKSLASMGRKQAELNSTVIEKAENIFKNKPQDSLSSLNFRSVIDSDLKPEDIFKNLEKAKSSLPNQLEKDKDKITLFVPMDEFLCHSALPDMNLGMINIPNSRSQDFRLELPEYRSFSYVYLRKNVEEFLSFINEKFEPILYTKGERIYVDKLADIVDKNRVFRYRLYQTDCHLYKNSVQDIAEYFRDIHLFPNRSLKRKLIIDFQSLNNVLQPDNS